MPKNTNLSYRDKATYWFAVLEIAKERGDFERGAEAQRELRQLGVIVRYCQPDRKKETINVS